MRLGQIANELNVSASYIKYNLIKHGVYVPRFKHDTGKFDKKEYLEISDLYKAGMRISEIGQLKKIKAKRVVYILKKKGVYKISGMSKEKILARKNKIIDSYNQGETLKNISIINKMDYYNLRRLLINEGIIKNMKIINKEKNDKIVDLYKQGETEDSIAKAMNILPSSIKVILRKRGVYIDVMKTKSQ